MGKAYDLSLGNDFLNMKAKALSNKSKKRQTRLYQNLKLLCNTVNRVKSQLTELEKIFANHISDKEINIQNIQRTPKTNKKITTHFKSG